MKKIATFLLFILIVATVILLSSSANAQTKVKSDTISTPITFGSKNLARFKQLEDQQRKIDSTFVVQKNAILEIILNSHGLEIEEVVKIEPKPNGVFIIKTKKK